MKRILLALVGAGTMFGQITVLQPTAPASYVDLNNNFSYLNLNKLQYAGSWAAGTSYSVNQAVTYAGGLYIAIQAGAGNPPSSSSAYWVGTGTYPAAGVANSTGSGWGSSYTVGTGANNLVQLNSNGQLPAVSAALLNNFPTLNQNTTGTAANVTGTVAVANGGTGVAALPGASGNYLYNNGGALGAKAISASDMPALTGDVTGGAGGAATTVGKVNGASLPADAVLPEPMRAPSWWRNRCGEAARNPLRRPDWACRATAFNGAPRGSGMRGRPAVPALGREAPTRWDITWCLRPRTNRRTL